MKRIFALLAGLAAAATLVELIRRRRPGAPAPELQPDDRVDELRRRLADRRDAGPEPPAESGQTLEAPLPEVDDARRRVHGEARATLDEMRRQGQI